MKLPESISHKKAVEFVKEKLEEELDIRLEIKKIDIDWKRSSDLVCTNPDLDQSVVVIVRDRIGLTSNGKLKAQSRDKLVVDWLALRDFPAKKKILVITDFQVYQKLLKTWYNSKGLRWREEMHPDTIIKLIEFPVFENNFAEIFNNKSFTVSQLLGAMKFNVLKYDQLPPEIKEVMLVMLRRLGYLRKKTKKIDFSSLDKK